MTEEEIRAHAARLVEQHNDHYEFSLVYEDDELSEIPSVDQIAILDAMYESIITVTFDD